MSQVPKPEELTFCSNLNLYRVELTQEANGEVIQNVILVEATAPCCIAKIQKYQGHPSIAQAA